ncbi:MAG: SDR family NAD(P)-dependent oxidoreductase [Vicinamibacterales bacterium]
MPTPPAGLVVAITGASAGIGAACARACAASGLRVSLAARRTDRLDAVAADIRAAGGDALVVTADVTSADDMARFVAATTERFGRLDVMICNAGIGFYGTLEETTPAVMTRLLDVNFMGTFHAARAAMPTFRHQRAGHLIVVSSIVGRRGIPAAGAYAATKFAQAGLAEALRAEFAGSAIAVSVVYPVSTSTEFRDTVRRDFGQALEGLGPRQSADTVARAILRTIGRPRAEVFPHAASRLLVLATALAPGWTDRLVQRFERRRTPAAVSRDDASPPTRL